MALPPTQSMTWQRYPSSCLYQQRQPLPSSSPSGQVPPNITLIQSLHSITYLVHLISEWIELVICLSFSFHLDLWLFFLRSFFLLSIFLGYVFLLTILLGSIFLLIVLLGCIFLGSFNLGICWPLCTHIRFELADDSMPSKGVRMFSSIREFFQRCKCFAISLGRCSST